MDWLSLLLVIMVAVVTYLLTLFGFVSALIMCVIVLLCTPFAFTMYEWLGLNLLHGFLKDLALPVAFMVSFLLPFAGLRFAMDALITRSNLVPSLIDKIGAGVSAFVASYVMAGVVAVAVMMVPLGGVFLGRPLLDKETGQPTRLWLGLDRVAVGYTGMTSRGVFSGHGWLDDHPDLVSELAWANSTPHEVTQVAPPGSVTLRRAEIREYVFKKTQGQTTGAARTPSSYSPQNPSANKYWLMVRVSLGEAARDTDEQHRFGARQIRLVGYPSPDEKAVSIYPVAINDNEDPSRAVTIEPDALYRPDAAGEVDIVFEVPDKFVPRFFEYKLGARIDGQDIRTAIEASSPKRTAAAQPPPTPTPPPRETPPPAASPPDRASGGRVSGPRGTGRDAVFSDQLPMEMTNFQQFDFEQSNGALANGHIFGNVADQGGDAGGTRVSKFSVPSDKRLFQFDVEILKAQSTLGQALSFAVTSLQNYNLHDEAGNIYPVVGQFAVADVDGQEVVEVEYFPEAVSAGGRGGMREFRRIREKDLRGTDNRLVYLFLVDPGARLTEFTTGAGRRPTDLRTLNLVAPN